MSVSKIDSFKPYISSMSFVAGLSLGIAIAVISDMRRNINEANTRDLGGDVKKGLSQRASIVVGSWLVTSVVAFAALAFRHFVFKIAAISSAGLSIAVMLSLKGEVQKNSTAFQGDTHAKLTKAVEHVFTIAIPALVAL